MKSLQKFYDKFVEDFEKQSVDHKTLIYSDGLSQTIVPEQESSEKNSECNSKFIIKILYSIDSIIMEFFYPYYTWTY